MHTLPASGRWQRRINGGQRRARKAAVFISTKRAKTFRPGDRRSHADRPAPIVRHQRDLLQVQPLDQLHQVRHSLGQAIGIRPRGRLVRQSAADVVGHDEAISPPQRKHDIRASKTTRLDCRGPAAASARRPSSKK